MFLGYDNKLSESIDSHKNDQLVHIILGYKKKSWNGSNPVFDSVKEKVKRTMEQHENPRKPLDSSLYTCFNVAATRYFPSQNRLGLLMRKRLYSTSVVIVTINGGMDDNVEWVFLVHLKWARHTWLNNVNPWGSLIDIKWLFEWWALDYFDLLAWMVAFGLQLVELIKLLYMRRPKFLVQLELI